MNDFPYSYKETFTPKFINNVIDLKDLLTFFQHMATTHISLLSFGEEYQEIHNFYYIINRLKLKVYKKLSKKEYTALTYPEEFEGIKLFRDLEILDDTNETCVFIRSIWSIIDKTNRRFIPIRFYKEDIHKTLPELFTNKPYESFDLEKLTFEESSSKYLSNYLVSNNDIDSNGHMNNTVYARIVQKIFDKSFSNFEINFEKECLLNDSLKLYVDTKNNVFFGKKEDNVLSFMASIN